MKLRAVLGVKTLVLRQTNDLYVELTEFDVMSVEKKLHNSAINHELPPSGSGVY